MVVTSQETPDFPGPPIIGAGNSIGGQLHPVYVRVNPTQRGGRRYLRLTRQGEGYSYGESLQTDQANIADLLYNDGEGEDFGIGHGINYLSDIYEKAQGLTKENQSPVVIIPKELDKPDSGAPKSEYNGAVRLIPLNGNNIEKVKRYLAELREDLYRDQDSLRTVLAKA